MTNNHKVNNENIEICKLCGGKCCKGMGCHYSPRDFNEVTIDILRRELNKGYVSIDWWEGDVYNNDNGYERVYYLRMRNKNAPIVDPSWGGECMLLTERGCSLPFDERPMGGRALIPKHNDGCIQPYSKEDCCKEWYWYQDVLQKLCENAREEANSCQV